ncbi:hypothetical protein DAMA08_002830 [Martiniozyma asiatica (nom. inval.)]|nr:hypothetical protein DAMA08_002830 [Martiniozyma asiatica]
MEQAKQWLSIFAYNGNEKSSSQLEPRNVYINQPLPDTLLNAKTGLPIVTYPRNKIRTTKYTPLNFIPFNIFFQFTNIANGYFLFIIILGCFQIFGVQNPGMQAVPLIVIVVLTAIKDAFEDSRRAISDYELNSIKVHKLEGIINNNVVTGDISLWRRFKKFCSKGNRAVLARIVQKRQKGNIDNNEIEEAKFSNELKSIKSHRSSMSTNRRSVKSHKTYSPFTPNALCNPTADLSPELFFKATEWKNINVGDIIKIRRNEEIPSDVIVLTTSGENGLCYVETKNLDGETNLKTKKSMNCGRSLKTVADFKRAIFSVATEPPSKDLYSFRGVLKYKNFSNVNDTIGKDAHEPITIENVLLRGSVLRNTNYAMCVIIATGDDTKIIMNSDVTPAKKSKISKNLNAFVIINFSLLFVLCFVSGLINGLFYHSETGQSRLFFDYEPYAPTPAANGVLSFFVNLILFQTLVPISLYITIEIIKTFQAYFIYSDVEMYYEKLDFPCVPKSWGISDDLGQIEYVFSDKTGTLTQNVMEFKKCVISDKKFGISYTTAQEGLDRRNGNINIDNKRNEMNDLINKEKSLMIEKLSKMNKFFKKQNLTFISSDFVNDLTEKSEQSKLNREFMRILALCHTAVLEYKDPEDIDDETVINYSAESPDEVALVSAARDMGFVFAGKQGNNYLVYDALNDEYTTYNILCILPFDSTRKRMSIILKMEDDEVHVFTKGADNIILQRCINSPNDDTIKNSLNEFSAEGLRTLCVAHKRITLDEFDKWHKNYLNASAIIDETRELKMNELADTFENDFQLLGATAIEDKLQDGVPHTIESIRKAGIKFWMLTGDKVETAISIGFSCSMLNNSMELFVLQNIENTDELNSTIESILEKKLNLNPNDSANIEWLKKDHSIPDEKHGLVIDGKTLSTLFNLADEATKLKFLLLCKKCCSVLCCRVSPAQKASVVLLVKDAIHVITLAIGDGANDVSMIQAANVGVGIAGEEGRQAAMSSDYAIGQFRFLNRLLLVHGRWSYLRLSEMIPCFFYKNVIFVMPLFWYGIFTSFDGTYLYEFSLLMLYNLFFTSLTVITLGCLDQDVPDYVALAVPQLYRSGINKKQNLSLKFIIYMIDGLYQSAICFFWPWLLFHNGNFGTRNGLILNERFKFGNFSAMTSILACNTYILLRQRRWDILTIGLYFLAIALTIIWIAAYSTNLWAANYYYSGAQCYQTASYWATIFVGVLAAMLPRFVYDIVIVNFFPRDIDIIRQQLGLRYFESKDKDLEISNLTSPNSNEFGQNIENFNSTGGS